MQKPVSRLTYISVLAFVWFSVGCGFYVFFGLFSGDLGFSLSHPHPNSPLILKFLLSVG